VPEPQFEELMRGLFTDGVKKDLYALNAILYGSLIPGNLPAVRAHPLFFQKIAGSASFPKIKSECI
jgi:hypothetical protein